MTFLLLLRPFLPWIIMAVVVGGGWVWTDQRCNSACKRKDVQLVKVNEELGKEMAARVKADRRADALDLAYASLSKRSEDQLKATQKAHYDELAQLDVQIKALRARTATLSRDLLRVFQRASETANQAAGNAAAPQGSDGPPAAVPDSAQGYPIVTISESSLAVFVRDAGAAYGSCSIKLRACVNLYNDARAAQLRSNDGN